MNKQSTTGRERFLVLNHFVIYGGPLLIFFGMVRLISFYRQFGISIVSYLEFTEIITSFFDILYVAIVMAAFTVIQTILTANKQEVEENQQMRQQLIQEENIRKIMVLYIQYLKNFLLYMIFMLIGGTIGAFFDFTTFTEVTVLFVIFMIYLFFIIAFIEIERKHHQFESLSNSREFAQLTLYFILATIATIAFSLYQSRNIQSDGSTFGVTIILDDGNVLKSDTNSYFIGKTQKYLFIYHEEERTSEAIPMSRVRKIQIPNRTKSYLP